MITKKIDIESASLEAAIDYFKIKTNARHTAIEDVRATIAVYENINKMVEVGERNVFSKKDLKTYSIAYKIVQDGFAIETLVVAKNQKDAVEQLVKQLKEKNITNFYYDKPCLVEE